MSRSITSIENQITKKENRENHCVFFFLIINRTNLGNEVDMADLTWEQKEQVLRALFIRMNTKYANITDLTTNE